MGLIQIAENQWINGNTLAFLELVAETDSFEKHLRIELLRLTSTDIGSFYITGIWIEHVLSQLMPCRNTEAELKGRQA